MLPVPSHSSIIVACSLAILALVLQTVDTVIQYRFRQKGSNYLPTRILLLVVILFADVGLMSFIWVDQSEKGAGRVPALWALVQSSMLLEVFLETLLFLRICSVGLDGGSRRLAYILLCSTISIILIFTILANCFALAFAQSHAIMFQALGCVSSHMFASLFPIWVLRHGKPILPQLRERRSRGLLSCSFCSLLAAVASLGLLRLPGFYSKYLGELIVMFISLIPWTVLQGYKLTKFDVGPGSTENLGVGLGPVPPVMDHELQVGSNGLVSKTEDLKACHKVVSWGQDSSTTFGEPPGSGGDGQEV